MLEYTEIKFVSWTPGKIWTHSTMHQCTQQNPAYARSTKYSPFFSLQHKFLCLLLPRLSVLQCHNVIKANHSIKTCNKWVMPFYQPSHQFMYTVPNFLTTLELNTLNLCPSLNMTDQDCYINKRQVTLHITFLNHCLHTADRKIYFTLTESHKLHIKYHKDTTQRNGMQQLWNSTVIQWIQTNAELWQKCSNT
jgi:hypothetical protein